MRIAAYCRVSTEEQVLHGLSIEAQLAALDEWGGDQIVEHYIDKGISGKKPASKRPELQRLLRDVEAGKIDLVAFTKLDRWFRSVKEYYKVQEILEKHKVPWRAIQEDYETETAAGRFKVNIMLSVAQDEADRTGERVKAVFEGKRQRGEVLGGGIPFGMKREGKHLVPGDDADAVKAIYDRYISTRSMYVVAKESEQLAGRRLTYNHVKCILSNEQYVRGGIIDKKQFDDVQEMRKERAPRSTNPDRVYLFNGLLFCPVCGRRLSGHSRATGWPYYYCRSAKVDEACPNRKTVNEKTIEQFLLNNILEKCIEINLVAKESRKAPAVDVAALKRKQDRLTDLLLRDLITPEKYEKEYRELQFQVKQAETVRTPVSVAEVENILAMYKGLSRDAQKAFWNTAMERVEYGPDGEINFRLRTVASVREWSGSEQ